MKITFLAVGLGLMAATLVPLAAQEPDSVVPISPPEQGFFSKKIVYQGIPIKAHEVVDDRALVEARRRLAEMLGSVPEIVHNLVEVGAELHIIGKDQNASDLPSERHWKGKPYETQGKRVLTIDERTRGVGGLPASCGEENLLKLPSDRYRDHRDICRHEFAHTVFDYGLSPAVRAMVEKHYAASIKKGLWKTAYASTNAGEFFAELTMWHFGSRGDFGKIQPKSVEGRQWLRQYDPEAAELLEGVYSGSVDVAPVTWRVLESRPTEEEKRLRSLSSDQSTTILFDNQAGREYSLLWLDFNGRRKSYGTIHAGQKQGRKTFATHPWIVATAEGTAVGIYVPDSFPAKVILEAQ